MKTFGDVEQSRSCVADPIWGVPSGRLFPEYTPSRGGTGSAKKQHDVERGSPHKGPVVYNLHKNKYTKQVSVSTKARSFGLGFGATYILDLTSFTNPLCGSKIFFSHLGTCERFLTKSNN